MKLKALVPMRDVSVRVENKNYRSFEMDCHYLPM